MCKITTDKTYLNVSTLPQHPYILFTPSTAQTVSRCKQSSFAATIAVLAGAGRCVCVGGDKRV